MNEDEQKQLLQKKIFDNPSLYISTHVVSLLLRLNARSAINTLSWNWPIITHAYISRRRKEYPKYCKETDMPIQLPSDDFYHFFILLQFGHCAK
jgi:hypothetical protein